MGPDKVIQAQRVIYLITANNDGTLNDEERKELEEWKSEHKDNQKVYDDLSDPAYINASLQEMSIADSKAALERIQKEIGRRFYPMAIWISAAASLCVFAFYLLYIRRPDIPAPQGVALKDIVPGGNRAMIRLSNGKTITLDEAKTGVVIGAESIRYDDGTTLSVNAIPEGKGVTSIITPRGGQYRVTLPDGSQVWLNASSSLSYNKGFDQRSGDRSVKLTGEAYFEVAKDKQRPFLVSTGNELIRVLGTHFNVNTYKDEPATITTLLEGSVSVRANLPEYSESREKAKTLLLKPGQQAILNKVAFTVKEADLETAVAWKNGKIIFKEADIQSVLRQVSRWYNLDVKYNGAIPKDLITGTISRQSQLSTLLKMFTLIGISYRIEEQGNTKILIINP